MSCNFRRLVIVAALIVMGGCRNLYRDFAHRTSTDYILYQAEVDVDNLRFDQAIANLEVVIERQPTNERAKYLYSVAHAGRAGLRVISIFETLSDSSGAALFGTLAESFGPITDTELADFAIAVSALEEISSEPTERTNTQNFYALFLYLGRIGAVINRYAYDDAGVVLTNFSACHTVEDRAGLKTGMTDDAIDIVMTMIPRIVETVDQLSSQGSSNLFDTSALAAVGTFDKSPIPCSTDSDDLSCLAVRTIVNNGSTGLGLGTGTGFVTVLPPGTEADLCPAVTP